MVNGTVKGRAERNRAPAPDAFVGNYVAVTIQDI